MALDPSQRLPVWDVIGHDPALCEFCKAMDAARSHHYATMMNALCIRIEDIERASPSTIDQESVLIQRAKDALTRKAPPR